MTRSVWKGPFVDGYLLDKAEKVAKSVRATDIVGCDEAGNIFIILLFVANSNRGYTEQRFEKAGLQVHWEN